jgi:hypothetical protein
MRCLSPGCFYNTPQNYSAPTGGLDFVAIHSASITGTVTRSDINSPVANVDVFLASTTAGIPLGFAFYPDYICTYSNCELSSAQPLNFSAARQYPNHDFAIPHLDMLFRSSFDQ